MKSYISILKIFIFIFVFFLAAPSFSQQPEKHQPTREEVLNMSYDDLLNLPFEDLINLANIVGVSADELLQMILNKDVSSASKTKEKVLQSPLSTTVISKEELEASGAVSIPEALRLVPGMIVREKTPGNYDIHIRGNDNIPPKNMYLYTEDAMSLIMIDNRPVYNYSFGGTFWETLPIDINDVERIEVIRGPSSALYGPNAVAGVINIITKNPETTAVKISGNVELGSQNSKIANMGISGGMGKFRYRVSGNYQHQERFEDSNYVFDLDKKLTYDQLDTLKNYWSPFPQQQKSLAYLNLKEAIRNGLFATDKYGFNGFFFYDLNKDVHFDLSAGAQQSEVVSTSLGNFIIPYTGRLSNTQYVDFKAQFYGFAFQTNYMFGTQNVSKGSVGYKIKPNIFNSQLEYEYKLGTLTLRPGVSYSKTVYSDKGYIEHPEEHEGFLNGDKELSDVAGFLRADYKPFKALRLIAAVRGDKYDVPDKTYFTYQFVSTYNLNENNLVRAVYSRANRGPFIVDSHGNYNWSVIPGFYNLKWYGSKNLNLPVMDMFEVGYRTEIAHHVMIDLEAFHSKTKDFSYFIPDSMTFSANWGLVMQGKAASPSFTQILGYLSYHNFDLESVQNGITCNISVAINDKLNFRVFGTLQETKLKNFYPLTIWKNFEAMLQKPLVADGAKLKSGDMALIGYLMSNGYNKTYHSPNSVDTLINIYQKSTPKFYGGASVDYTPFKKLKIFGSMYTYSTQDIETNKVDVSNAFGASNMYTVDPKVIIDLKVTYKFCNNNSIFVNARNLLNNRSKEFAYTDEIGGLYMAGINFNF